MSSKTYLPVLLVSHLAIGTRSGTYHASHAPDIGTGSPLAPQDDLRGPVLSGLNVVGKVVVHPARITKVGNFDADDLEGKRILGLSLASR